MLFTVVGQSESPDSQEALQEILAHCRTTLAGRRPKAGMLLAAIDFDHALLLGGILDEWPGLELTGCTTDGELSSIAGFSEDSVTLMLFGSDEVDMTVGVGRSVSQGVAGACRFALAQARAKTALPAALCLTFPESLTTDASEIVSSLTTELGAGVPVLGATSGDQWRFAGTFQFHGREVLSDCVPVLLFSGPLVYSFGVACGWNTIGNPGKVTRSEGRTVYEIDGVPALQFFRNFFGKDAVPSPEFALAVLDEEGAIECLRATTGATSVVHETGAINFFAKVDEGAKVQITIVDRHGIVGGCTTALDLAFQRFPAGAKPTAAVLFSCAARKMLLGTRANDEIKAVRARLTEDIPIAGFYGYGEIGPSQPGRAGSFHNETFVSLLLGS